MHKFSQIDFSLTFFQPSNWIYSCPPKNETESTQSARRSVRSQSLELKSLYVRLHKLHTARRPKNLCFECKICFMQISNSVRLGKEQFMSGRCSWIYLKIYILVFWHKLRGRKFSCVRSFNSNLVLITFSCFCATRLENLLNLNRLRSEYIEQFASERASDIFLDDVKMITGKYWIERKQQVEHERRKRKFTAAR